MSVSTSSSGDPLTTTWKTRNALGLPSGSVRGLLSLVVLVCVWVALVLRPEDDVPAYMTNLMFLILGHFFATLKSSTPDAGDAGEPPPLFLSKAASRGLTILGFVVVLALVIQQGKAFPIGKYPALKVFALVIGFLVGVVHNDFTRWWRSRRPRLQKRLFEDAKAVVALAAALLLALLFFNHYYQFLVPRSNSPRVEVAFERWRERYGIDAVENVLTAIIGYYFGSRS